VESSDLAGDVMRDISAREAILPNQVVLHSDNGSPMKGATMLATLQALALRPRLVAPAVSNDNPYFGIAVQDNEISANLSVPVVRRLACRPPVGRHVCAMVQPRASA